MRVLIADDRPDVVEALRLLLKSGGFQTETASSPSAVLRAIAASDLDLVLMDLNYTRDTTSGREGLDLLDGIRAIDPTLPTIVMTAWGTIEGAVEALRRGARDYVQKPWDSDRLMATVRTHIDLARALRESRGLELEASRERARQLPPLITTSAVMRPILDLVERVAPSDANVLILGEHGSGKEVVARWVHEKSHRACRPFVTVDAGGLAPGTFESELFGHVRGAFTDARSDRVGCVELADRGTLFLDEIGNVPLSHQVKLLRVLQLGEFHPVGSSRARRANVRVVAATNADLRRDVAEGRFREDLLYRINTVEIRVPPLRERREDIPALAEHFLKALAARYAKPIRGFDSDAMQALMAHGWPGNVRELEHVVERAVLMASTCISRDHLGLRPDDASAALETMTLEEAERQLIQRALARADGNVSTAAAALGLSRSSLYRRLEHHGIRASRQDGS